MTERSRCLCLAIIYNVTKAFSEDLPTCRPVTNNSTTYFTHKNKHSNLYTNASNAYITPEFKIYYLLLSHKDTLSSGWNTFVPVRSFGNRRLEVNVYQICNV